MDGQESSGVYTPEVSRQEVNLIHQRWVRQKQRREWMGKNHLEFTHLRFQGRRWTWFINAGCATSRGENRWARIIWSLHTWGFKAGGEPDSSTLGAPQAEEGMDGQESSGVYTPEVSRQEVNLIHQRWVRHKQRREWMGKNHLEFTHLRFQGRRWTWFINAGCAKSRGGNGWARIIWRLHTWGFKAGGEPDSSTLGAPQANSLVDSKWEAVYMWCWPSLTTWRHSLPIGPCSWKNGIFCNEIVKNKKIYLYIFQAM